MFSTKNQLEIIDNNSPQALEFLDLSTRWNHFMSQEQTLNYLGMHEISSSTHVLEMCRILSEAKAQWKETNVTPVTITKKNGSGLNKRVEVKENDWDRFLVKLNEIGQSEQQVERLIKIWSSYSSVNGAVRKVYSQTAYLPTSKTALHLIATLNLTDPIDIAVCNGIINEIGEKGEIGVLEIRALKKNNGLPEQKVVSSSSSTGMAGVTELKLPSDKAKLGKIKGKWKEIKNAIDTINNLALDGFRIETMTPDEKLAQMELEKKNREIASTLRQCQKYVDTFEVDRLAQVKDLKSSGSKLTKENEAKNKKIDDFFKKVETYSLTKQCEQIIKAKKDALKREQQQRQKASTGNAQLQDEIIKSISASNSANNSSSSSGNTAPSTSEKSSHWD